MSTAAIRTVLVDDEEPARERLRAMLADYDDLEIVGEACDGQEAVETIDALRPDVIFLDIQMPGLSGLEVAASLTPPRPRVVFCTAFDQYAIEAFEHHAADYLLKPVSRKRLVKSIDRLRVAIAEQRARGEQVREVEAASEAQDRLLPRSLPPMSGLDYAGACRAARGVGGDYYDFLALPGGQLGIALGDVSGKGLFAGLLVAGLQARIQSIAPVHGDDVEALVTETNRTMHDSTDSNRYATLFYAVYDDASRRLRYVNAGHNPPIVLRGSSLGTVADGAEGGQDVRRLEANGTVVGLLRDATYQSREIVLAPGDVFALFSDGVTEARDADGREYGEERVIAALARHAELPASALLERVLAEISDFSAGTAQHDDISLVVARAR